METLLEDPVGDLLENDLDGVGFDGTGDVDLDALGFHIDQSIQIEITDPFNGSIEIRATLVLLPSLLHGHMLDLLLEDIALIQEQEDGQTSREGICVDSISPDVKRLLNTELSGFLILNVVLVQRSEEDDSSEILLRVDPLTTLDLLTSNVNQSPLILINLQGRREDGQPRPKGNKRIR